MFGIIKHLCPVKRQACTTCGLSSPANFLQICLGPSSICGLSRGMKWYMIYCQYCQFYWSVMLPSLPKRKPTCDIWRERKRARQEEDWPALCLGPSGHQATAPCVLCPVPCFLCEEDWPTMFGAIGPSSICPLCPVQGCFVPQPRGDPPRNPHISILLFHPRNWEILCQQKHHQITFCGLIIYLNSLLKKVNDHLCQKLAFEESKWHGLIARPHQPIFEAKRGSRRQNYKCSIRVRTWFKFSLAGP